MRKIGKNKKGMFFTLLAVSLLSLFLVSYTLYLSIQDREAINKRINTLNNFVFSVEQDLPRRVYIAGFRSIFLLEKKIIETGNYITNLNETFQEVFFNGTLYQEEQELMQDVTFSGIQGSLNKKARKINANVTLSNPLLIITQDDPWNIKFSLTTDLLIEDNANLVLWNKTKTFITYISIENFEDPLYAVNTNGLVTNKINKTIYESFVQGTDVSNLLSHAENSFYINSSSAPSFLDRLQGRTTASENGIESLVYLPELFNQGIILKEKSCVDYIYFSSNNPLSYKIQGMPLWFKLDEEHLGVYGVEGLTV